MGKLGLKNIIIIFVIITIIVGLNDRYIKYKDILKNRENLLEDKENLEKKLKDIAIEREEEKRKIKSDYEQIQVIIQKLDLIAVENESSFKKMIYIFARESGLKMREISKSEKIWERNGYKLKYIHFTLFGGLNSFGKFLYYVNKSKKYIDTTKMYIELTGDEFKISLGFIERKK